MRTFFRGTVTRVRGWDLFGPHAAGLLAFRFLIFFNPLSHSLNGYLLVSFQLKRFILFMQLFLPPSLSS